MFEAFLTFCIAADLSGSASSECFGRDTGQPFASYAQCRVWADQEEIDMAYQGVMNGNLLVVQISCGKGE